MAEWVWVQDTNRLAPGSPVSAVTSRRASSNTALSAPSRSHTTRASLRLAVVEDQAAGVQVVVDVVGRDRAEPADDLPAEGRGDVARGRPGPEPRGFAGVATESQADRGEWDQGDAAEDVPAGGLFGHGEFSTVGCVRASGPPRRSS